MGVVFIPLNVAKPVVMRPILVNVASVAWIRVVYVFLQFIHTLPKSSSEFVSDTKEVFMATEPTVKFDNSAFAPPVAAN